MTLQASLQMTRKWIDYQNTEPESRIRFEKAWIIVQIRSQFLIGLCEHVMIDWNHFNIAGNVSWNFL